MRKPTMSSQEDLDVYSAAESDKKPEFDEKYRQGSRNGINGYDPSDSRMRFSNGIIDSPGGNNDSLPDITPSSSYSAQRQPINEAVTSAVNKTESTMSPELIQLITQNVIQQLQVHQSQQVPSAPPVQPPQPPSATNHIGTFSSFQSSPNVDRATVYTPPSPSRHGEEVSETESRFTMPNHPDVNTHDYKASRRGDISPRRRNSTEDAILSDSDTNSARPGSLRRASTDAEATVLERHWGKLFDEKGQSTERLALFLKGIANHLIEEIEPRHSLVITPDKMLKFYEETSLEERPEVYPWRHVFDDKTSSISRLLRDQWVQVQHHLVQALPSARPDIPGLTPDGFVTWLTLLIQAHPDHEHERLTKILRLMAINHPEERKQRFPAALPRSLLPATGDVSIATRLSGLMATHCKIKIESRHNSTATTNIATSDAPHSPRKMDLPPAPTVEDAPDEDSERYLPKVSDSPLQTSPRSRNNVQTSDPPKAPSVTSIEDNGDDVATSQFFERERKPYVAQPGIGKSHDVASGDEKETKDRFLDENDLRRTKSVSASQRSGPPPPISVHQKPQVQPPYDLPELSHARTSVEPNDSSSFRSRRYSGAAGQAHPSRRTRSNSMSVNEPNTRYYPSQRSPSMTKSGFDFQNPRATAPEVNYGSYHNPTPSSHVPPLNNYQQPPNDRYVYGSRQQDPRLDSRYSTSQRERSRGRDADAIPRGSRQRHQSNAGVEGRSYYDDSYRTGQQGYPSAPNPEFGSNPYQFPPSAYRDNKER